MRKSVIPTGVPLVVGQAPVWLVVVVVVCRLQTILGHHHPLFCCCNGGVSCTGPLHFGAAAGLYARHKPPREGIGRAQGKRPKLLLPDATAGAGLPPAGHTLNRFY